MSLFPPPTWLGFSAVVVAALVVLLFFRRLIVQQAELRDARKKLLAIWQAYLNATSVDLERLRTLRSLLAQCRPTPQQQSLSRALAPLYAKVTTEVGAIEKHLVELASTPDGKWTTETAQWRPGVDLHDDVAALLDLAGADVRRPEDEREIQDLTTENKRVKGELVIATKELAELRPLRAEVESLRQEPLKKDLSPMAAAARLMGELESDLTSDQVDGKVAATAGEIAFCTNQIAETTDEDARKELQDRVLWAEQVKRWWALQKDLWSKRKKVRTEQEDPESAAEDARTEEVKDFQLVESQNAELRRKLSELMMANRQMGKRLGDFSGDSVEDMKEALKQAEMARKRSEREMANLAKMMDRMEEDLVKLRASSERLRVLERDTAKRRTNEEQSQAQMMDLTNELAELKRTSEAEKLRLETTIVTLARNLEGETKTRQEMEDETTKLQTAYDHLQAQVMQFRSNTNQAEQRATAASEELAQQKKENNDLQSRYRELREQFAEVSRELGKRPSAAGGE